MEKYPILNGRQRKMCKSKAILLEAQVLMALPLAITYGFVGNIDSSEVVAHNWLKARYIGEYRPILEFVTISDLLDMPSYEGLKGQKGL